MGKNLYWIGILGAITLQMACEGSFTREINVDYTDHKTEGVIFSILSNSDERDTAFRDYGYTFGEDRKVKTLNNRIYITNSKSPGYSGMNFYGANLTLGSEEVTLPLKYHKGDEQQSYENPFYTVEESIQPGRSYHITAEFNPDQVGPDIEFWSPFSASDIMPEPIAFILEDGNIEYLENNESMTEGYVDLKIEDEPGRLNIYQAEISLILKSQEDNVRETNVIFTSIKKRNDKVNSEVFGSFSNDLFEEKDFTREGRKRIYFHFKTKQISFDDFEPFLLMVRITNLSENYIRFLRSSRQYYANQDNPFVEPVEIFSNVKNGYGIFALGARSYAEMGL